MRRWVALIVGMALAVPVGAAAPASAGRRALVFEGRGFGHGFGMGQWGARGMSERGAAWPAILRHYYRGVDIDRRPRAHVRVLIATAPVVTMTGRLRASRRGDVVGTGRWMRARRAGTRAVLERAPGAGGPWSRVARLRAGMTIRPSSGRVWLVSRAGWRAYPGSIHLRRFAGEVGAINDTGIEAYIAAVVPREMPAVWPIEALRAQAVAARSYALAVARVARARGAAYDLCATTACQAYEGLAWRRGPNARARPATHPRSARAVRDTAGVVLTWKGAPILAQYSSSSGGWTDRGAHPYLRAVRDRADAISPYHSWTVRDRASHVEYHWPAIGTLREVRVLARNGHGAWGGRVRRIAVVGTDATLRMSGASFARTMGLRSDWFRIGSARARARAVSAATAAGPFHRDLTYGDRHADVRRLQLRLRRERVYPSRAPITTYFGPITRGAVRRYQSAHDIEATGNLGPITRARLNGVRFRFTFDMGFGASRPEVRELQHRLRTEGVYPADAPRTTYFGPITRASVRRYQRAHGLTPTGYLGPATRRSLNRR